MSSEQPPTWDFYRDEPAQGTVTLTAKPLAAPPPKITGYRTLTDAEIAIINRVKAKAEEVRELIDEINVNDASDLRWLSIGRTDLQKGFMAVIRAIARPETF